MTSKDLSKEVLQKIKDLRPTPKWQFLLKDYTVWGFSVLLLIIGSLAFSVIIFLVANNDWVVYENINDSLLEFILLTLPYVWIALLGIFIIIADYNFKHTKRGYKYGLQTIVISSIVISIIFGSILYNFGVGQAIDRVFEQKIPFYPKMIFQKHKMWIQPEKGLVAGVIVEMDIENLELKDIQGNIWKVDIKEVKLPPMFELEQGMQIKIAGEKLENDIFKALRILPPMHQKMNMLDQNLRPGPEMCPDCIRIR